MSGGAEVEDQYREDWLQPRGRKPGKRTDFMNDPRSLPAAAGAFPSKVRWSKGNTYPAQFIGE